MAAWLEIVVGAIFLTVPDVPCRLLFAAKPEGVGVVLARFAGVGLFALGIACLPSTATGSHRSAVFGLLVFNAGVATLFAWVGIATTLRGVLLWPVVVLHAVIAAALLPQLLTFRPRLANGGEERAGTELG
jgi:heme A synthase